MGDFDGAYVSDDEWETFRDMPGFDRYWNLKVGYDTALYGLTRNCTLSLLSNAQGRSVILKWHGAKHLSFNRLDWETNVRPAAQKEAAAMIRQSKPVQPKAKPVPKKRETLRSRMKTKKTILVTLANVGSKPLTPTDVAEKTGISLFAAQKQLQRLKQAGDVEATKGRYSLIEEEDEDSEVFDVLEEDDGIFDNLPG